MVQTCVPKRENSLTIPGKTSPPQTPSIELNPKVTSVEPGKIYKMNKTMVALDATTSQPKELVEGTPVRVNRTNVTYTIKDHDLEPTKKEATGIYSEYLVLENNLSSV